MFTHIRLAIKLPVIIVILAMLAAVSTAVVSGYMSASGLQEEARSRLESLLKARETALSNYLHSIREDLMVIAANPNTLQALQDFKRDWQALGGQQMETLQRLYITENPHPTGEKDKLVSAGDSSAYTKSHREYHPWFHMLQQQRDYYDVFLFDLEGNLVYSVFKELDYATNMNSGEWKDTDLANAFRAALKGEEGKAYFFDFRAYAPSHGAPASFISTPILGDDGVIKGVLVYQMPIGRINSVLQASAGMGETGETYLVGQDYLMRSDSRFSDEPTILVSKIESTTTSKALKGQSGVEIAESPAGVSLLSAYQPFDFEGVRWALMAEIEKDEIYSPINDMIMTVVGITLAIAVIVALVGFIFARSIAAPVARTAKNLSRLASGDGNIEIEDTSRQDEIGDMVHALQALRVSVADAFRLNQMVEIQPAAVMLCDLDLNITYANTAANEILMHMNHPSVAGGRDAVIGKNVLGFHKRAEVVHTVLDNKENLPYRGKFEMGGITIENQVDAIKDADGHIVGTMLSWKDVTEYVKLAENFESSVKSVVSSVGLAATELQKAAQSMSATAQHSAEQSATVSSAAQQATENVQTVSNASDELSNSITEISAKMQESVGIANDAVDESQRADQMVQGLAAAANQIGEVVNLITDIADQTNLLALNATIEAARAGDAGKGFAVVASEVKNLANQTARATEEISNQIGGIQAETNNAVTAIQGVGATIARINEISASIAAAVEQQGAATTEISRNVEQAASATSDVTSNIQEVSLATQKTGEVSGKVEEAAADLMRQARDLESRVNEFLAKISQ